MKNMRYNQIERYADRSSFWMCCCISLGYLSNCSVDLLIPERRLRDPVLSIKESIHMPVLII